MSLSTTANSSFSGVTDNVTNVSDQEPPGMLLQARFPEHYFILVNGYLSPILVFFTVITNILVVAVLLKRHMRSPTNVLLVGMALSDMFTGLIPLPVLLYFFGMQELSEWVPHTWCYIYKYLFEVIPIIFHSASIWLTMSLAVQRYIYICHSIRARTWCTIPNALRGTLIIYIIAILSQTSRFFDYRYTAADRPSIKNPNVTIHTCIEHMAPWVIGNETIYYNIYFWFRVIFIHLIPCSSLIILNGLLISAMRAAQVRRMQLLKQNKKSESKKLKDSNCTTLMLVAVVGLFLLVEFPLGIIMIVNIVDQTFTLQLLTDESLGVMTLFSNFFILLSYPLNFFIYCGMSRQFRETFKRMFTGGPMPLDRECSQYMTLPTENGKTVITGEETAL